MRGILVSAIIFLLSSSIVKSDEDMLSLCGGMERVADSIMTNRQNGVSMSKMMDVGKDSDLIKSIIVSAYKHPRYSTDEYKNNAISDFSNSVYLMCIESFSRE